MDTPVGRITLTDTDGRITALTWGGNASESSAVLHAACSELAAYFDGRLSVFSVPLCLGEAGFQRDFLKALCDIPFGQTRRYGDLAKGLGVSAQAVGQACGANRVPILIPCHRVLGANGLGGYSGSGGIETKVALLRLEGAASLLI
jgi:methylated-DNA-[protein]-cysteine S-methyltransferase